MPESLSHFSGQFPHLDVSNWATALSQPLKAPWPHSSGETRAKKCQVFIVEVWFLS